ncbi:hypothetical protein OB905_06095 [Halobacteria archaeon AArc-dxtr1]|nr:hypothetical protein [Halobacteria archaeon AArc-dxtr1]
MRRWVLVGLLVVLLVAAGYGGVAGGASGEMGSTSDASNEAGSIAVVQDESNEQEFDRTQFDVTVHENDSATWTFRYEQSLDDGEIDAFESFAAEFEDEEMARYDRFVEQAEGLTQTGAERTDREMEATSFSRSAGVEYGTVTTGVVEMTFVWEGFAVTEDDTVVVGDAFGRWFLDSDQHLIVRPGDGLAFDTVSPDGEYSTVSIGNANSVTWTGEQEFIDGEPRIVFEQEGGERASWLASTDVGLWQLTAILGVGAVLATVFIWWRHRAEATEHDDKAEDAETSATRSPLPEDELVTDEDIVVNIIRENGGRMKQVDIVAETDWSKSKVSMLLSEMEEEGTISKLRVGRENIISLDGYEPEATKSPFEE